MIVAHDRHRLRGRDGEKKGLLLYAYKQYDVSVVENLAKGIVN